MSESVWECIIISGLDLSPKKSNTQKEKNNRVLFLISPPNSYPRKPNQTQSQPLPFISVQLASRVLSKPNLSLTSLSLCAKTLDLSRPFEARSSELSRSLVSDPWFPPPLSLSLSLSSGKNPNPNPNFPAIVSDMLFAFVLLRYAIVIWVQFRLFVDWLAAVVDLLCEFLKVADIRNGFSLGVEDDDRVVVDSWLWLLGFFIFDPGWFLFFLILF